jgi:DNA helicase HerA-like ATPase
MCNRHGLIAGATGTGKTVSLQVLAETFSQAGVPCFMADMKGDLSGISQTGTMSSFIQKRCAEFGIENPQFQPCPVRFWDVFGEQGYPMRTTVSAMGPQLLARLLGLNDTQTGVLNIVFRIADDNNLLLIDIKDLRLILDFCGKNASKLTTEYGMMTSASIGAIQRAIMTLESEGAEQFFGEPAFNIQDLIETENGRGIMNVLCADKLMLKPKLYSTFLLWLITELYANLPEVGDQELPKLVFFFDEAHMLFEDTSKALVDKIEQVIRLVRSKGVGIYFVTQSPTDIPQDILGQLGNRIQHALRAYTPKDQKAVRTAAETFRANPEFNTAEVIMELGTGEALVSFLDAKGAPTMVERARILFPLSQIGAITAGQRLDIMNAAPDYIKEYKNYFDRESAYEVLSEVRKVADEQKAAEEQAKADEKARIEAEKQAEKERKEAERAAKAEEKERKAAEKKSSSGLSRTIFGTLIGAVGASVARSVGNSIGKSITGGSKKSSSSSKSSSSKSKKSSSGGVGDIFGKAAKSATTTATRKITQEILKGLFK